MTTMSDRKFGRLCGTLISLALEGTLEDMDKCLEHIMRMVLIRKKDA